MSFCRSTLTDDDRLLGLLVRVLKLPIPRIINLGLYGVSVGIYWSTSIRGDKLIDVRNATGLEVKELELDIIIEIDPGVTKEYDDKSLEALIASMVVRVESGFKGRENTPTIFINKEYYELDSAIVNFYGKGVSYSERFFKDVDTPDPNANVYQPDGTVKKVSPFEEVLK